MLKHCFLCRKLLVELICCLLAVLSCSDEGKNETFREVKQETSRLIITGHHNGHLALSINEFDTPDLGHIITLRINEITTEKSKTI